LIAAFRRLKQLGPRQRPHQPLLAAPILKPPALPGVLLLQDLDARELAPFAAGPDGVAHGAIHIPHALFGCFARRWWRGRAEYCESSVATAATRLMRSPGCRGLICR
jgi:hypothetical protein